MATTFLPFLNGSNWNGDWTKSQGQNYQQLTRDVNSLMTEQALAPYLSNLPGYANMVGQRSQNTQSMLQGQLPQDVIRSISQGAAERGIAGGGGTASPNTNAAYLRALGLNSLDLMGKGSEQLSQSIADTPVPELWNPMSLYVPTVLAQQQMDAAKEAEKEKTKPKRYAKWETSVMGGPSRIYYDFKK